MSDEKQNFEKISESILKVEGTVFTNFSKPYLDFLGKGKLFGIVYIVMAIINLILPFVIIYQVVNVGLFESGQAKFIITFILSWIVIAFACWVGFQLWWDRKSKIKELEESEFIVTPIFSELFQTFGEWIGTLIGIIGAGVGLIATIILGDYASYLFRAIGLGFLPSGIIVVIAGPLIGFVIIILSRFIAEQIRLFVALVNNTKNIANKIK
jgi:tetrahydromethanopterin S-methyltransferase subunit G